MARKNKFPQNKELRTFYARNERTGKQEKVTAIMPKGLGFIGGTKKGVKFKKDKPLQIAQKGSKTANGINVYDYGKKKTNKKPKTMKYKVNLTDINGFDTGLGSFSNTLTAHKIKTANDRTQRRANKSYIEDLTKFEKKGVKYASFHISDFADVGYFEPVDGRKLSSAYKSQNSVKNRLRDAKQNYKAFAPKKKPKNGYKLKRNRF